MIFGFETVSIDSPDYGKKFWEKWRAGQTYCDAWLNASWDIHHGQAPSVAAAGATQAEAVNRLDTERNFYREHVPDNWYAWRWYNAREGIREPLTQLPGQRRIVRLAPRDAGTELARLGQLADFPSAALQEVHDLMQNSGANDGSETGRPVSLETHVTFRQVFDGVPVITPDRGLIRVGLDNDGTVVQSQIATREATGVTREPSTDVAPPEPGSGRPAAAPRERDPREALDAAQRTLLAHLAAVTADEPERQGAASARDLRVQDVPGTFEVGYELEGDGAYPVARKLIQIGAPDSMFRTRRWVVAPLAR